MDSSGLSAFTRPGSYWQASRAPRYSLLFALPLLVFYQVLAALQSQGAGGGPEAGLRNGADVILQSLFVAVAGTWGPVLFMACLIAVGLWLVVRDLRRRPGALRPSVYLGMLGESTVLALLFGVVVGTTPNRSASTVDSPSIPRYTLGRRAPGRRRRSRTTSHRPTAMRQAMNSTGPQVPATATNRLWRMTSAPFRSPASGPPPAPCDCSDASTS